ncbi:nucleotide exchange factor GrpE [Candidatus Woesearchaeota archaeon]|nr:nucleotide exchange factor GrpE [Candidatus Woesearchaeota archaeon]
MEKQKNNQKKAKKQETEQNIEELTSALKQVQADFENYRKRTEKEQEKLCRSASKELIIDILPVLDSFELALKDKQDKGLEMLYSQLMSILEKKGLKQIEALDKKFDPYLHEALLQEKSEKEEGIVLEELQKGYMLNDDVVRHTKVKVSKK